MLAKRRRADFKTIEEAAQATAKALDEAACGYAHTIYWSKKFQKLATLDSLGQEEQDRIVNELILACLVLLMLMMEAPDLRADDEVRVYLRDVADLLPRAHVNYLRELGIEKKYLRDWEKLIDMRLREYARDRHDVRAAAMTLESQEKELDVSDLSGIQLLLPLQAVAIGCHCHICRSKTDGRDELFKLILDRLSKLYIEFRILFDGGRITPLHRAAVAVRRFFRKLRGTR